MDSSEKARAANFRDVSPDRGQRDNRKPRERGSFKRPVDRELQALLDTDRDILRLLGKRAGLMAVLRGGEKLDSALEKKLRMAWEEGCLKVSRNPRLARDMFSLIQGLEPAPKEEGRGSFTLSPALKPVEVDLPAPRATELARICMGLAVCSGKALALQHVTLNDPELEAVKAFNQLGGELRWEDDGRVNCPAGKGLRRGMDKVVHVGDDFFNLALVLAFSLGMPMRLKLAGGENLRMTVLGSLRHFLPVLGARLTSVIPGQEGLPVRVECSGMLPDVVTVPGDVPMPFVVAMLCAAPLWEKEVQFELNLGQEAKNELQSLLEEMHLLGARYTITWGNENECSKVQVHTGCELPEKVDLPAASLLTAYMLAIPAFVGGSVRLNGRFARVAELADILSALGVTLKSDAEGACAEKTGPEAGPEHLCGKRAGAALYPLAVALAARQALGGRPAILPMAPESTDPAVVLSFLSALGLEEGEGGALRRVEGAASAWISPNPAWCMAYALCAFVKPGLRLANPYIMNTLHPLFWNMYNSLPKPDFRRPAVVEKSHDKPVRRRIIAEGVFGEVPPDQLADNDF